MNREEIKKHEKTHNIEILKKGIKELVGTRLYGYVYTNQEKKDLDKMVNALKELET